MSANTMNAIGLLAICLAVAVGIASCSWASVETTASINALKLKCFEASAEWSTWTQSCAVKP